LCFQFKLVSSTETDLGVEVPDKEGEVAWGSASSSGGVHLPMSLNPMELLIYKKRDLGLGMEMEIQANLEERVVAERELLLGVDAEAAAAAEPEGGLHGRVGFSTPTMQCGKEVKKMGITHGQSWLGPAQFLKNNELGWAGLGIMDLRRVEANATTTPQVGFGKKNSILVDNNAMYGVDSK
jgi:hypothetical protein